MYAHSYNKSIYLYSWKGDALAQRSKYQRDGQVRKTCRQNNELDLFTNTHFFS